MNSKLDVKVNCTEHPKEHVVRLASGPNPSKILLCIECITSSKTPIKQVETIDSFVEKVGQYYGNLKQSRSRGGNNEPIPERFTEFLADKEATIGKTSAFIEG